MKNIAKKALITAAFALTATSGVQASTTQADVLAALDADAAGSGLFNRATNQLTEGNDEASSASKSQLSVFQAQATDTDANGFRTWNEAAVQMLQKLRSGFAPAAITSTSNVNTVIDTEINALNSLIGGTGASTTDRVTSLASVLGTDAAARVALTRLGGTPAAPVAPLALANGANSFAQAEVAGTAGARVFNALLTAAPAAPDAATYDPSISDGLREIARLMFKRYTTLIADAGVAAADTTAAAVNANIDDSNAVTKATTFLATLRGAGNPAPTAETITFVELAQLAAHMNLR